MNLVRWDPFRDFDTFFDRRLPRAFGAWPRFAFEGDGEKFEWAPTADISETEKEYLIRAELPAVKKEDVKVTVDDGMITIQGERKQQKDEKSEQSIRVENYYGSFTRSFTMPEGVKSEGIRCESKDGVLTIHMPKAEIVKKAAKQIKVE